jgi:hypothetical protein
VPQPRRSADRLPHRRVRLLPLNPSQPPLSSSAYSLASASRSRPADPEPASAGTTGPTLDLRLTDAYRGVPVSAFVGVMAVENLCTAGGLVQLITRRPPLPRVCCTTSDCAGEHSAGPWIARNEHLYDDQAGEAVRKMRSLCGRRVTDWP